MSKPAAKKRLERALRAAEKRQSQDLLVIDAETLGTDTFLVVDPDTQRVRIVHVCLETIAGRTAEVSRMFSGLRVDYYQRKAGKIGFSITKSKPCQEGKMDG